MQVVFKEYEYTDLSLKLFASWRMTAYYYIILPVKLPE